jgi:hypothetical protein
MKTRIAALVAASAALGLAACGSDDKPAAQPAPTPAAKIDQLSGQSTAVALDANFVKALGTLKLTPAPVGDGTISKQGIASFPITGGNVTYYTPGSVSPYVQGETGGGKKVELTNFVIDPGKSVLTGKVTVDGQVAAESAPLFFLDGRTLKPLETEGSTAILEGTTVKLKAEAADLLNKTFGTDALQSGLVIGVAKITVDTA